MSNLITTHVTVQPTVTRQKGIILKLLIVVSFSAIVTIYLVNLSHSFEICPLSFLITAVVMQVPLAGTQFGGRYQKKDKYLYIS